MLLGDALLLLHAAARMFFYSPPPDCGASLSYLPLSWPKIFQLIFDVSLLVALPCLRYASRKFYVATSGVQKMFVDMVEALSRFCMLAGVHASQHHAVTYRQQKTAYHVGNLSRPLATTLAVFF